jgi:FkbM family methyltransferase
MGAYMNSVAEIFDKYNEKRTEVEISLDDVRMDLGDMIDSIVLYGAGSAGIAFLKYLQNAKIYPRYFADSNEKRFGEICEGVEIIAPGDIVRKVGEKTLVIVCINTDGKRYCKSFAEALRKGGHGGVYKMLAEYGCKNVIDYTYFRRCHVLFHEDPYNLPSCSDVHLMEKHQTELEEVYEMLEDDVSRDVFLKIIEFRMIDDNISIPTVSQVKQYFEYEFYPKKNDEVFVDCGAFNGISLKAFLQENHNQFKEYYGFEPDSENYGALETYVQTLSDEIRNKMFLYEAACYDKEGNINLYSLHGPGSFVADIGRTKVKTLKIDDVLQKKHASYIKMNIEGSELPALKGAEYTIKNHKPKLAIAAYHKTWDMWEIPLLIKKYKPEYKFYLRSYMNHLSFVYYGI